MDTEKAHPARGTTWSRPARIIAAVLIAIGWVGLLLMTRSYWPHLILAGILAYLLHWPIRFMQQGLRFPRGLAVAVALLLLLAVIVLLLLLLPALGKSMADLVHELGRVLSVVTEELVGFLENNREVMILGQTVDLSPVSEPLIRFYNMTLVDLILESPAEVLAAAVYVLVGALRLAGNLASLGAAFFIILTFTFYLTLDRGWIRDGLARTIPPAHRDELGTLSRSLGAQWKTYIIGQLGVMLAVGIITGLATLALGVHYALALGLIAGMLEIIPHLGPILATVPALVIALVHGSRWFDMNNLLFAIIVGVAYIIVQQIEDHVLTPSIQGHAMEMPSLVVMLSVLVGLHTFGIVGGILALPVLASLREIFSYVIAKIEGRDPFSNSSPRPSGHGDSRAATAHEPSRT